MHLRNSEASKALILYVPALHAGYVSLFKKHKDAHVFVLGKTFIENYPRLNRDIRALAPEEASKAIESLKVVSSVSILEVVDVPSLSKFTEFVMAEDEVTDAFSKEYLRERNIQTETTFLRWDITAASKELPVIADRTISVDIFDQELMLKAKIEASKSSDWWRQIGGVLVQNGKVLYSGHTRYFPSDQALNIFGTPRSGVDFGERPDLYISMHAEADLIAQAAGAGTPTRGASVYVSTFPCINCAFLLARAGIAKVYYAEGYSKLDSAGVLRSAEIQMIQVISE